MNIKKKVRESLTKISPVLNTKICYRIVMGGKLDLKNPQTLNEKSCWLKLYIYNKSRIVRNLADKYKVRKFVKKRGCSDILNDLIAVYEYPEDIEWDMLPKRFAIKLNVGSKANLICKDIEQFNIAEAKEKIKQWYSKENLEGYYLAYGEMQYKNVKPLILIEEFLEDDNAGQLIDYKFYCINGKSELLTICCDRFSKSGVEFYMYDDDWHFWPCYQGQKNPNIIKTDIIDEAKRYAEKLSKGFPYVRVDLYIVNEKIYFGEMTFTGSGGFDKDIPMDLDIELGNKLVLK